jgi:hypothetical protein
MSKRTRIAGEITLKIVLAASVAVLASIVIWLAPGDYNHDLAALMNKRDLLVSKKPPRMLFIGGSNLATLDSGLIEHELTRTGDLHYSVVNMGLWAGLSVKSYLEEIERYLREGDIVVICQEYSTMLNKDYMLYIQSNRDADMFYFLMSPEDHALRFLRTGNAWGLIKNVVLLNQLKIKTYLHVIIDGDVAHRFTGGYYRYARDYNSFGDRKKPFRVIRPLGGGVQLGEPDLNNLEYLLDFNKRARGKNISVYFSFPPFPDREFLIHEGAIASLSDAIRDRFNLTILNTPLSTVYPEACFADTVNHLRPECEKKRTAIIIEHLRHAISQDTGPRSSKRL